MEGMGIRELEVGLGSDRGIVGKGDVDPEEVATGRRKNEKPSQEEEGILILTGKREKNTATSLKRSQEID